MQSLQRQMAQPISREVLQELERITRPIVISKGEGEYGIGYENAKLDLRVSIQQFTGEDLNALAQTSHLR